MPPGGAEAGGVVLALIGGVARNRRVSEDTAIGVLFAGTFALGIFLFTDQWTSFIWPLVVLSDQAKYPITVGISLPLGAVRGEQQHTFRHEVEPPDRMQTPERLRHKLGDERAILRVGERREVSVAVEAELQDRGDREGAKARRQPRREISMLRISFVSPFVPSRLRGSLRL